MQTTEIKERPILFNGETIRAILDGRKTMTRRVIRAQPPEKWDRCERIDSQQVKGLAWCFYSSGDRLDYGYLKQKCPYGKPGDRLYVRETWQTLRFDYDYETSICDDYTAVDPAQVHKYQESHKSTILFQKPDYGCVFCADDYWGGLSREDIGFPWRPSIHMPRWASRITLEVTGVRVERVQDIGIYDVRDEGLEIEGLIAGFEIESDGRADGCQYDEHDDFVRAAKKEFARLWDSINAKRGYSFESNRWVWVIEFKHVKGDGDAQ